MPRKIAKNTESWLVDINGPEPEGVALSLGTAREANAVGAARSCRLAVAHAHGRFPLVPYCQGRTLHGAIAQPHVDPKQSAAGTGIEVCEHPQIPGSGLLHELERAKLEQVAYYV